MKDLCARLPYGITIYHITDNSIHHIQYSDITESIDQFSHFLEYSGVDNIKPYLRPMESMTDEEHKEWFKQSRVEYEVVLHGWPCDDVEKKIDVYEQIMMNLDIVASILMENVNK